MEFKEAHSDGRRTIFANTELLNGKEVSIIKLNAAKAIGGCMHSEREFYTIISGLVIIRNGDEKCIETDGSSGIFNPLTPHAFFALRDSIIMEWGITPEDKLNSKKDGKLLSEIREYNEKNMYY